ncbi:IPIL1 protein, partial [Pitta sordida]|nr:IPIL1 protein [Pitta sordida]
DWSIHENRTKYCQLTILQPPPGHSFILATPQRQQPSNFCICVVPECTCSRGQVLGKSCCLHPSGDLLPTCQCCCLLGTLCTDTYLDPEKVACWVQRMVVTAWLYLHESYNFQFTLLPSCRSCRFQLTDPSGMLFIIELVFAVQQ